MENQLVDKVKTLFNKYKNDEFILNKLINNINTLENTLSNDEDIRNKKNELSNQIWSSQEELSSLIKEKYKYSFLNHYNLFFIYTNEEYLIIKEDDIYLTISEEINNFPLLASKNKFKTISLIMKQIKSQDLYNQLPSEIKVKEIMAYFANNVFINESNTPSENESILFFIILSEILIKKQGNLIYFINSSLKSVISIIYNLILKKTGINTNFINGNFITKNHKDTERSKYMVLFAHNNINIDKLSEFITNSPISFLLVCRYFHNTFESSSKYLDSLKLSSYLLYNHIHYVSNNTNETIVKEFLDYCLEDDKKENLPISWKNMQFIWNYYLEIKKFPNMIYSQNLKEEINKVLKYDSENDIYLNITSKYLPKISDFLKFWKENFIIINDPKLLFVDDEVNEFDLDEITLLYKKSGSLSKYQIKNILNHYYGESLLIENETIINVKSTLWNKSNELNIYFESNPISDESNSILKTLYNQYMDFFKSNNRFVTFDYFKKYYQNKF